MTTATGSDRAPPTLGPALLLRTYYVVSYAVGGIYLPFFPKWLEGRGMTGLSLGAICAAAPAMGLIAPSVFGVLADLLGVRVGLLQIACAGSLVSFGALTGIVALRPSPGFHALFVAALCIALFRSPMTLIADVVALERAEKLGTTYGRIRLWGSLGFLTAALLSSEWVDPQETLAFPLVCMAAVAGGLMGSLALPRNAEMPKRGDRHGMARLLGEDDFQLLLTTAFLGQCAHVAYDMCFSLRMFDLGVPRPLIGLAWALGTGSEVILMAWSAPFFRAIPAPRLLALALAAGSTRWVLLSVVRAPMTLLALQPLHALSFGLFWLSSVSYTAQRFPTHSLGTAQGLLVTAMGAGSIVGMLMWGPLYAHAGGSFVFGGAACVAALASVFAMALDRKVRAHATTG